MHFTSQEPADLRSDPEPDKIEGEVEIPFEVDLHCL